MMWKDSLKLIFFALTLVLITTSINTRIGYPQASSGGPVQQLRTLDFWQARIDLKQREEFWLSSKKLLDKGLLSKTEYIKDRTEYENALIRYRRSAIVALDGLDNLTIERAVKIQGENGSKFVRLTIRNRSPETKTEKLLRLLAKEDPTLVDALRLDESQRVYVSLKDSGTTGLAGQQSAFVNPNSEVIIAKPYEAVVSSLPAGRSRTLRFRLLKDIENVIVSFRTNGRTEFRTVKLEFKSRAPVTVNSSQFSQEVDLGQVASFDLIIERGNSGLSSFKLLMLGLPNQIRYEFRDPSTLARLSEINFLAGVTSKQLNLRLFMPDTPGALGLDKEIRFQAVLVPSTVQSQSLDLEHLQEVGAAYAELQLIPRGRGELQFVADTLYIESKPRASVETAMTIRNTGSRRIDNIRLTTDLPARWRSKIEPKHIEVLEVNEERVVHFSIDPSVKAERGEFSVRVQSKATSGTTPLKVEDVVLRVKIIGQSNFLAISLVVVLLIFVIGVFSIILVRITRR